MQHTPFPGERQASQKELHERLQARTGRAKRQGRATEEDRYKTMTWPVAHTVCAGSWCLPPSPMETGTGVAGYNGTRYLSDLSWDDCRHFSTASVVQRIQHLPTIVAR